MAPEAISCQKHSTPKGAFLMWCVRRVTLDLDRTDYPTHGAQQLSFFNGHYDAWCCLAAHIKRRGKRF